MLGNFQDIVSRLKKISIPDFTQINNSIFRFTEVYCKDASKSKKISENLNNYFDFLQENSKKEIQSHFASLCSADNFPETLAFISMECQSLYERLMDFIFTF